MKIHVEPSGQDENRTELDDAGVEILLPADAYYKKRVRMDSFDDGEKIIFKQVLDPRKYEEFAARLKKKAEELFIKKRPERSLAIEMTLSEHEQFAKFINGLGELAVRFCKRRGMSREEEEKQMQYLSREFWKGVNRGRYSKERNG